MVPPSVSLVLLSLFCLYLLFCCPCFVYIFCFVVLVLFISFVLLSLFCLYLLFCSPFLDRETKIDLKKYSMRSRKFSEPLADSGLSRRFDQTQSSQGKMARNMQLRVVSKCLPPSLPLNRRLE